ncbi:MAG: hypothetical protein BMS9Abin08_0861 [Gammaproteobacteria bacterium]|nr:MAG: hypothetical protein BMS9Abin08_0861 [Gammaproteobacteria bacterium]
MVMPLDNTFRSRLHASFCEVRLQRVIFLQFIFFHVGVIWTPMEILYFSLAAIFLYVAADWIVKRIETAVGRRFEYRSLIFFAILLVMALTSFALIRHLTS